MREIKENRMDTRETEPRDLGVCECGCGCVKYAWTCLPTLGHSRENV